MAEEGKSAMVVVQTPGVLRVCRAWSWANPGRPGTGGVAATTHGS